MTNFSVNIRARAFLRFFQEIVLEVATSKVYGVRFPEGEINVPTHQMQTSNVNRVYL